MDNRRNDDWDFNVGVELNGDRKVGAEAGEHDRDEDAQCGARARNCGVDVVFHLSLRGSDLASREPVMIRKGG